MPCRTAIDARKWHEIDADMTLEHVMGVILVTVECPLMCRIAIESMIWTAIDTGTSMRHVWER